MTGSWQPLIDAIIEREGGYVDHPSDRGGPTKYGITHRVARAHGYTGAMRDLPREVAEAIYLQSYVTGPGFDRVASVSWRIGHELADSGVHCGTSVPRVWLQRWLNALNRRGADYPDLAVDGVIGPATLAALSRYLGKRGAEGETVLFVALNCSQGQRYLELAEARASQEDFLYGWLRARVAADLVKG